MSKFEERKDIITYFTDTIDKMENPQWEHKFFQCLNRFYRWFKNDVVAKRPLEFIGKKEPSEEALEAGIVHTLKYPKEARKFTETLKYGPKFSPAIREQFAKPPTGEKADDKTPPVKIGYSCKAFGPDGVEIPIDDLIKRKFTCQVTFRLGTAWKMVGTNQCGLKWELERIDIIQWFDVAVDVEPDLNMYGELPEPAPIPDDDLIAAADAAEAEHNEKKRERDEDEPEPVYEDEPLPVEAKEEEEESSPVKKPKVEDKPKPTKGRGKK